MKTLKFWVKTFQGANGEFRSASVQGKYLPLADSEEAAYYTIRFSKLGVDIPAFGDGMYELAYDKGGLWIDKRPDYIDKHIIRVVAKRVVKAE